MYSVTQEAWLLLFMTKDMFVYDSIIIDNAVLLISFTPTCQNIITSGRGWGHGGRYGQSPCQESAGVRIRSLGFGGSPIRSGEIHPVQVVYYCLDYLCLLCFFFLCLIQPLSMSK